MKIKSYLIRPLAVAALLAVCGVSHAAFTVFTTAESFAAATSGAGVDTYDGFLVGDATSGPIYRSAGAYTYTASASTTDFFGAGTTEDPSLSTDYPTDSTKFFDISGGATAIGGNFYSTDKYGNFVSGDITIVALDSLGDQSTQTITGATVSSFLGFLSTGTISSLSVTAVQPDSGSNWSTVDNLTIAMSAGGAVPAVPEPETYALMLAGLGVVGFMARRHRG